MIKELVRSIVMVVFLYDCALKHSIPNDSTVMRKTIAINVFVLVLNDAFLHNKNAHVLQSNTV